MGCNPTSEGSVGMPENLVPVSLLSLCKQKLQACSNQELAFGVQLKDEGKETSHRVGGRVATRPGALRPAAQRQNRQVPLAGERAGRPELGSTQCVH